jgi:Spy/CpxP family protein refolding chaperone
MRKGETKPRLQAVPRLLFALSLLTAGSVWAQQPQNDPIAENLFPPELVMQNQQLLGLNEEQTNYFKTELRQAQLRFVELQWQLQDEMEKLVSLIKVARVDEQQMLAQLEKVLNQEREIKRAQMTLLARIKNKLTNDQQNRLRALKAKPGEN